MSIPFTYTTPIQVTWDYFGSNVKMISAYSTPSGWYQESKCDWIVQLGDVYAISIYAMTV